MKEMGCVILAGGRGTRLGVKGPKGCVKVYGEQTLFEILLKKMKGPVAIMTSPLNHEETASFLEAHQWFGVEEGVLFTQDLREGYPDGNGKVFKKLYETGIWNKWDERGIKAVGFIPIDNPLSSLEGLYPDEAELVVRCVPLESKEEKIGRVIVKQGHVSIEEYTERAEMTEWGYTGQFGCTMPFIQRVSRLPTVWHEVIKEGKVRQESFIFDVFPYATSHKLVISERERYFTPIKDPLSLAKVRR